MKIVTTTSVFPRGYSSMCALERLARVGFPCLDLAFDYCVAPEELNPKPSPYLHTEAEYLFEGSDWKAWAKKLRMCADGLGVKYTQAHAPYGGECHSEMMVRSFEVCRILGIGQMVVHPVWRDSENRILEDEEEFIKTNVEAMKPLLEVAEKNDVVILSENLLWGASIYPENISNLVEAISSPYFSWCWDIGHSNCFGISPKSIRNVKHVPKSLHIHDNHGAGQDEHLFPGDGNIDWKEVLDTLKAIGYAGDVVMEAHHQSIETADEQREELLRNLLERCHKMQTYMRKCGSNGRAGENMEISE